MIKRLRIKFICINMALVTVVLVALMVLFVQQAHLEMENRALEGLKQSALEPGRPGKPGHFTPTFTLYYDADGNFIVHGGEFFDLSDTAALERLYMYAQKDGRESGVLKRYDLRYYRTQGPLGVRYVFADCSYERAAMDSLVVRTVLLGIGGFGVFLAISIALAFWAVRPVERAWEQQRQFLADASHELKTPLTVILTNAELLQADQYSPEEQARFSGSILQMSLRMRQLLEGMLDLARSDSGRVTGEFAPLDLSNLAEEAVMEFEPVYFEHGRSLLAQVEPGIRVQGDSTRLRQAVDILLDNGVKYSAPGSETVLTLKNQGRGKCLLTVHTPGTPLTAQQCRDIFQRFYRVDEARTGSGSYGLGLPIAEDIVRRHGGKIRARGEDGGNTFSILLSQIS